MQNCIMIHTLDSRKFFISEKLFFNIVEYARTFGAEVSLVGGIPEDIVHKDLALLAESLSNKEYDAHYDGKVELIEVKIPMYVDEIENVSKKIEDIILSGEQISVEKVKSLFSNNQLYHTVYYTMSKKIHSMKKQGHNIVRVARGAYQKIA